MHSAIFAKLLSEIGVNLQVFFSHCRPGTSQNAIEILFCDFGWHHLHRRVRKFVEIHDQISRIQCHTNNTKIIQGSVSYNDTKISDSIERVHTR